MRKILTIVAALLLAPGLAGAGESDAVSRDAVVEAGAPAAAAAMPFASGEKLVYQVSLLGITAGEAELQVEKVGETGWRIHGSGRTVGATDSIFGLRQSASCTVEGDLLSPQLCLFTSKQRGGLKRREVRYDTATGDVRERILEDGKRSEKQRHFDQGIHEALSGLYLLRKDFPAIGETTSFHAIRKGKAIRVEVTALREETVETEAGRFAATLVDLKIASSVDKDAIKAAQVWFTSDARRIPVKVTVEAPVGSLEAKLVAAAGTLGGSLAGR